MGGYGALKLGLAKPESFAAVASLSGAVSLSSTSFGELLKVRKRSYWEGIFGPLDQIEGSIHDPLYLLQQLVESQTEMPQFYLCCGEQDMLLSANQQMAQALEQAQASYTFETGPGEHDWVFWDEWIQKPWLGYQYQNRESSFQDLF